MKKFKNSRLSTDSRKLQTLALNNLPPAISQSDLIALSLFASRF